MQWSLTSFCVTFWRLLMTLVCMLLAWLRFVTTLLINDYDSFALIRLMMLHVINVTPPSNVCRQKTQFSNFCFHVLTSSGHPHLSNIRCKEMLEGICPCFSLNGNYRQIFLLRKKLSSWICLNLNSEQYLLLNF